MFSLKTLVVFVCNYHMFYALEAEDIRDQKSGFLWSDCGGSNASIHWQDIQILEPAKLKNLTIGAKYEIVREVPPGSFSRVEVWRMMKLLFVPIHYKLPCNQKFGSCDYDVCRVMDADNFCTFQRQHTGTCGCPMTPKVVEGYNFRVKVPERKVGVFQSLFAEVIHSYMYVSLRLTADRLSNRECT